MKLPQNIVLSAALCVSIVATDDLDFVDTEADVDNEAALKCDACRIVTYKFSEAFTELQGELKANNLTPNDEDIISTAESVCDGAWEGYSVTVVGGQERLAGEGAEVQAEGGASEDSLWSRRLQDMCDELLAEASDEKSLYNTWASGNSLEDYLCRGESTFAACSSDDWGPWPGDDYEMYEDSSDMEDIHDEF